MIDAGFGTFRSLTFASVLSHSDNKRVSGFATLRLNPRLSARTSDTRRTSGCVRTHICMENEQYMPFKSKMW